MQYNIFIDFINAKILTYKLLQSQMVQKMFRILIYILFYENNNFDRIYYKLSIWIK